MSFALLGIKGIFQHIQKAYWQICKTYWFQTFKEIVVLSWADHWVEISVAAYDKEYRFSRISSKKPLNKQTTTKATTNSNNDKPWVVEEFDLQSCHIILLEISSF